MEEAIEIIPLGGLGEFGMNCTAVRFGSELILLDAGMGFPSAALGNDLGVDLIVPDITFLKEHQQEFRAIFLTHGHEDHSGAISYIINELPVPVYGSRLTLGLVRERLKERRLEEAADLREVQARQVVEVGPFQVEFLHVTHSFPDSFCLGIQTPLGRIVWSGDFKFDQTPVDRKLSDIHRLSLYGEEGVLALFSDSTNSGVPGLSPSEFSVYEPLRNLFARANGKIIITTFASAINRIQIVLDLARERGRKVVPAGRSMVSNIRTALDLGYLNAPADLLVSVGDLRSLPPEQVVILASGSQGEPMSALSRLAIDEFKGVRVEENDIVILSARIIPGNEKLIFNMVNHFYRRGARVFDPTHSPIHVSGHGFRDDLKLMMNLTRPRFFIPIHGEYKQLKTHALLALNQQMDPERVIIIENGDVLRLTANRAEVTDKISIGRRFIDEGFLEEVHDMVLRDRRYLSEDGFVVVVLRVDRLTGELIGEPEILSRGFVLMEDSEELMAATRNEVAAVVAETPLEEKQDEDLFKEILRKRLKRFLRKQTGKRPVILSVTIEI